MLYKELSTEQLEQLLKRYNEKCESLEGCGARVTFSPRTHEDQYLMTATMIRGMIEKELQKRNYSTLA